MAVATVGSSLVLARDARLPCSRPGLVSSSSRESLHSLDCSSLSLDFRHMKSTRLISAKKTIIVQATYRNPGERSNSASIFVGGFILGGVVVGALGCVYAQEISRALSGPDRKELMKKLPKFLPDDKILEKTRKELATKIEQLNSVIDKISSQYQKS